MAAEKGTRRVSDAGGFLSPRESHALVALERDFSRDARRLAGRLQRFGARGRFARFVATVVFVSMSASAVLAMAWVTPVLAMALGTPVCVLFAVLIGRVYDGPRAVGHAPSLGHRRWY